jgi:hypothetical protein
MNFRKGARIALIVGLAGALAGCGGFGSGNFSGGLFGGNRARTSEATGERKGETPAATREIREERTTTLADLFATSADPNTTVEVNKYLWLASLEVLNFLPVQSVDPFSGVFATGFGTPPGGGGSYRATVYVTDPALDARSLKVALVGRGGPVDADTQRAVEDAILTRARQLRIQDRGL